jgi:SAM-dependent methyltransferase
MNDHSSNTPYSNRYYESLKSDSLASATEVVPIILEWFPAKSVVDVGCGAGYWTSIYAKAGCAVLGIDGANVRPDQLLFPSEHFLARDLMQPLALDRQFDLVHCVEVAEHLHPNRADSFVADLCKLGSVILFSAAVPGQGGTHHVNEQWQSYWIERFARHQFMALDCLRPVLWNNPRVAWWYCQNLFAFVHTSKLHQFESAQNASVSMPTDLVHPRAFEAAALPSAMSPRMVLEVTKALPHFPKKVWQHLRR